MNAIREDALEYWMTLRAPADGWGMHVHPKYGASHWFMLAMWNKHGRDAFEAALDATRPFKRPAQ